MNKTSPHWFWTEIDALRDRSSVLDHPFYQRWSAGTLTAAELQAYAAEYAHAVIALAAASRAAEVAAPRGQRDALRDHADEEADHIGMWRRFARETCRRAGTGSWLSHDATSGTVECVRAWVGDRRAYPEILAALYAIESAQPEIARVKLEGLVEHYGYEHDATTEYFSVHAVRDEEHTAELRATLDPLLDDADPSALLRQAEDVYRGNWALLDWVS